MGIWGRNIITALLWILAGYLFFVVLRRLCCQKEQLYYQKKVVAIVDITDELGHLEYALKVLIKELYTQKSFCEIYLYSKEADFTKEEWAYLRKIESLYPDVRFVKEIEQKIDEVMEEKDTVVWFVQNRTLRDLMWRKAGNMS